MTPWSVDDRRVEKALVKMSKPVRGAYSAWRRIASYAGPPGLREVKGFHFEKLKGQRQGQWSCRLNRGYRVIFLLWNEARSLEVLEVNKHEY